MSFFRSQKYLSVISFPVSFPLFSLFSNGQIIDFFDPLYCYSLFFFCLWKFALYSDFFTSFWFGNDILNFFLVLSCFFLFIVSHYICSQRFLRLLEFIFLSYFLFLELSSLLLLVFLLFIMMGISEITDFYYIW